MTRPLRELIVGAVFSAVIAVISVLVMVTVHRHTVPLGGAHLPTGLLLGACFQIAASVLVWSVTGARASLVVLAAVWGLAVMPFAGRGAGGGILMPAVLGEQVQYSGVIVQLIGVGVPFAVLAVISLSARRRNRPAAGPAAPRS